LHRKDEQPCEQRRDQKRQQKPANSATIAPVLSNNANDGAEAQIKNNEFHGHSPFFLSLAAA
jgi:hypothetical protein